MKPEPVEVESHLVRTEDYALMAYRAQRRANRPFRRAFPGGEARRRILMKAGLAMAAERNRKAAGL